MLNQTDQEAAAAILVHHVELLDGLRACVQGVQTTVRGGVDHAGTLRDLIDYLEREVLPHAAAEERALYPAGETGRTTLLVRAMLDEHRNFVAQVMALKATTDAIDAVATASVILALFKSHLSKENDLLVPALVADPHVSLSELLGGMHELVG